MLRSVRQKLRLIRYYSAPRPQTAWTQATDIALVASLLLAIPAVWVCDSSVMRRTAVETITGQIFPDPNNKDGYIAVLLEAHSRRALSAPAGVAIGNFEMSLEQREGGWPLVTTRALLPARLTMDLRTEPRPRVNAQLPADDPLRAALEHTLKLDHREQMLAAWLSPEQMQTQRVISEESRSWSWIMGAGIWWIMLTFGSVLAIQMMRLGWLLMHSKKLSKREQLRAEGKCIACGYDMRGLEFNERCPECGELVW